MLLTTADDWVVDDGIVGLDQGFGYGNYRMFCSEQLYELAATNCQCHVK